MANQLFARSDGAKFKFDEETHDFGIVRGGDKATDTFWFTNVCNRPLNIYRVKLSCGCTDR